MTLSGYLHVLRERWKLVLTVLLLGIAIALMITWTATARYAASVMLYVSAQDGDGDPASAYQGNLMSQQKVKSYTQLLTGGRLRADVERRLGTTVDPDMISATAKPDTVLLTTTATDTSPERARQVADAIGEVFPGLVAELERRPDGGPPSVVVRVVEPASLPTSPVSPRPLTNLALGGLLGLVAGVLVALARNALDSSVKSTEVMAELTNAPTLGTISTQPDILSRPLIIYDPPGSPTAEALRQIRTNLQFVDVDHPPRVVTLTSALAEEGKTSTACNLAIALAQAGSSVLLIDADLRRPRIADNLGLEGAVGLTSVLIGRAGLEEALQPWRPGGMTVLASGPPPPNPSELLASRHMADLLADLGTRYDAVILDTPPLLPVTDAAILASRCDGALLVVRYGRTTRNQVRTATAALAAVSARLLGTVLTMTPRSDSRYGYGYYTHTYPSATAATGPDPTLWGIPVSPNGNQQPVSGGRPGQRAEDRL